MNLTVRTATLLCTLLTAAPVWAGVSGNVGVTSNYIWRGVTQTRDAGAVQAGIDYKANNGFYVGGWSSNIDFGTAGTEVDVYTGFAKELKGGFSYDIGAIRYNYARDLAGVDFTEIYGKAGFKGFGAEVDYTVEMEGDPSDYHDLYYAVGYNGKVGSFGYGAKVGKYDFDNPSSDDYNHAQISVSKAVGKAGDIVLAVDKTSGRDTTWWNDEQANKAKASIMWKKTFDF